jgi:hypothetical protein
MINRKSLVVSKLLFAPLFVARRWFLLDVHNALEEEKLTFNGWEDEISPFFRQKYVLLHLLLMHFVEPQLQRKNVLKYSTLELYLYVSFSPA